MNRSIILPALVTAFVALSPAGVALADNPHDPGTTGQPNKDIEDQHLTPTPGFGSPGFANAEQHYAGSELNPNEGQHRQGGEPVRRRRLPVEPAP